MVFEEIVERKRAEIGDQVLKLLDAQKLRMKLHY